MEKKTRVILADANEEFRELLRGSIEKTGEFEVVGTAGDGMSALKLVTEKKPQLLITDILLPELDGFGLLDRLADILVALDVRRHADLVDDGGHLTLERLCLALFRQRLHADRLTHPLKQRFRFAGLGHEKRNVPFHRLRNDAVAVECRDDQRARAVIR